MLVDEDGVPKLCDYGLVFIVDSTQFTSSKMAGASRWVAPEVMNPPDGDGEAQGTHLTKKSDVYAFSMLVLEVRIANSAHFQCSAQLVLRYSP